MFYYKKSPFYCKCPIAKTDHLKHLAYKTLHGDVSLNNPGV